MRPADFLMYTILIGASMALAAIIWNYYKGLRKAPRDMWLLFLFKIVEYTGSAAMNMTVVLWLSRDCGLGDVAAGSFISGWSILLSVMGMFSGALVDAVGLRKTQIISVLLLIFARVMFTFLTNPTLVFVFGFIPMGIGFAIVGPLVSVAIKRFTTKEGAALGFGLFYVLMNCGYAMGGMMFDWIRGHFASRDAATGKLIDENAGTMLLGHHFSTYQLMFVFGACATLISLTIAFFLREGVRVNDNGDIVIDPPKASESWVDTVKNAAVQTGRTMKATASERYFWTFMGMLSITLFVRFVFFHFQYTFPKYGLRVLGDGAKIGSIYGVLNPVLIVFLVPIVAYLTKKVSSYKMMIVGATVSSFACFIGVIPSSVFAHVTNSVLGELVFVKWLRMAPDMAALMQNPPTTSYWPLIFMVTVFTVGESIWSPRLMQFTAEIAPKGREGSYIALAVLPFFVSKFFVGPLSGWLVKTYTPLNEAGKAMSFYPNHQMVWVWIGGMAILTPIGLLVFHKLFTHTNADTGGATTPEKAALADVAAAEEAENP